MLDPGAAKGQATIVAKSRTFPILAKSSMMRQQLSRKDSTRLSSTDEKLHEGKSTL